MLLTPWPPEVQAVKALLDSSGATPEVKVRAQAAYFSTNRSGKFQALFVNMPISAATKNALWNLKFPTTHQYYSPVASQPAQPDYKAMYEALLKEQQSASTVHYAAPAEPGRIVVIEHSPSLIDDLAYETYYHEDWYHSDPIDYSDPLKGFPGHQSPQHQVHCSTWTDGMTGSINCY